MPRARSPGPSRSTFNNREHLGEFAARVTRKAPETSSQISHRISSWRAKRPDIVRPHPGTVRARSAPPYHLHTGIRPARVGAILPHVPDRTAEIRPAVPAFGHHEPAARSPPTARSRPGPSRPRPTTGRPAPITTSCVSRTSSSATSPRRSGARCCRRCGSIGGWCSPAPSPGSGARTGALPPSSPTRISCCCWKRCARPALPLCSRKGSAHSASPIRSVLRRRSRYSLRSSAPC